MDKKQLIKEAREKAGLTQLELGKMLGFSEKTAQQRVGQWEIGYKPVPRSKIAEVAKILDLKIEDLL